MKSLFSDEEIVEYSSVHSDSQDADCIQCGLYRNCQNPKLEYSGAGRKECLVIAEANGPDEDKYRTQLIGKVGQFFKDKLLANDLDLNNDFWRINAVNCFPNNKGRVVEPTSKEIACCRPYVFDTIRKLKPKVIWVMGAAAMECLFGDYFSISMNRWRGLIIPDRRFNCWIVTTAHPSYGARVESDKNLYSFYLRDLGAVCDFVKAIPELSPEPEMKVNILLEFPDVVELLNKKPKEMVFDYETTGLKPHRKGHYISCISVCSGDESYAFPFSNFWKENEFIEIRNLWKNLLNNREIGKIAHNMKFEDVWSREILRVRPNFIWDTALGAHVLDNRREYAGLKFQTYINFGILPYDMMIKQYIESNSEFNKIHLAPRQDLLHYCGLDSLFTYKLYKLQQEEYSKRHDLRKAYDLTHRAHEVFAQMQVSGISVDCDYFKRVDKEIGEEIEKIDVKLTETKEAREFELKYYRPINVKSTKDLGILFEKVLKVPGGYTEKGSYITDAGFIGKQESDFAKLLLRKKKLEKIQKPFISQFISNWVDGKVHPFFDVLLPITYRSSSSDPNMQNIPKRDGLAQKYIRTGIKPSKGNKLLEIDFSQIEVCVGACYHKDAQMISYINDPTTNMHTDTAADLFKLPLSEITKAIRQVAKGQWVFAQFYGDYYVKCAQNIWESINGLKTVSGVELKLHLCNQKIFNLTDFTNHCEKVEHIFWNERFKTYKKWKDNIQKTYQRKGYLSTYFGFNFSGYMKKNELCNYQIQGTAFHVLLWCLFQLIEEKKKRKWRSQFIGQIHDSMLVDLYPPEQEEVVAVCREVCSERTKEFKWLIVPLKVEMEISEVDGNWFEKKELK